jgi:hypothetical protein
MEGVVQKENMVITLTTTTSRAGKIPLLKNQLE